MIIKPKKMSDRREENEQLNSFKENLFGNLKDSFKATIPGLHGLVHGLFGTGYSVPKWLKVIKLRSATKQSLYEQEA